MTRKSFPALLAGCVLAALAFMVGSAGYASAQAYPPAPPAGPGTVVVGGNDGDQAAGQAVTACGGAGATDASSAYTLTVGSEVVASGVSSADGSYCATGAVPSGLPAGLYIVTFASTKGGAPVEVTTSFNVKSDGTFGVDPAPVAPTTTPLVGLPRTGSSTGSMVQLASVLMAAGAGLLVVLAVRRRNDAKA